MQFDYVYGENVEDEYPDVSFSIERITPQIASKWLESNIDNRPKKREPLANAIRNGEWKLNGDAIRFSKDGVLRDGQNRLMAIVETGIAVDSVVIRGIAADSQITMDSGVKRQVNDFLKMKGYKDHKDVGSVGLALCRADKYGLESAYYKEAGGNNAITTTEAVKYVDSNYEERIAPILRLCRIVSRRFRCVRTATVAPLMDKFIGINVDDAYDFAEQLAGSKKQCQPVQVLVTRLTKADNNKQSSLAQSTIAALIIKTWNAYMQGNEIGTLKFTKGGSSPEAFPEIFGLE